MTDQRDDIDQTPIDPVDASGLPLQEGQIIPPEQPPMDDAAGGPQAGKGPATDDETDDLAVQGGE